MKKFVLMLVLLPVLAGAQTSNVKICDAGNECATVTGGKVDVNATVSATATTQARATAAAPSYTEGTLNDISQTLDGALRIAGTINASSSLHANASAPTYTENTDNPFSADLSGRLRVTGAGGTFPVTGTFWQATQPVSGTLTCNAGTGTLAVSGPLTDTQLRATAVPVSGTFWQATQPVSGTVAATQSGTWTVRNQDGVGNALASSTTTPAGTEQALIVRNIPSGTQAVSGTFWQATQPVSGPLTDTQLRATAVPVSGTFWQATQPVSGTVTSNQGTAAAGSGAWPITVTDTANTVVKPGDGTNNAIRVNVVAGGAGGGVAQLQVYDGAAWDNVGGAAESASLAHLPVKIQGTGANVIEPLNSAPGGTEYALPVRVIGSSSGDPSYTDATGTTVPANAAFVAGTDGTNTRAIKTDVNGELQVDVLTMPTTTVTGTVTANAGTGTFIVGDGAGALNVIVDSLPTVTVTDGAGALNVILDSGTLTSITNTVSVQGTVADNSAAGSTSLGTLPGIIETSTTLPTRTDGSRAALLLDGDGKTYVRTFDSDPLSVNSGLSTATTLTQIIAAPGASLSIYITDITFSASVAATTTTDQQMTLKYGTGTNCGTGTGYLWGAFNPANGGAVVNFTQPIKVAANSALCWIHAAAGSKIVTVNYFVAP